jgi:hypothetical protein
MVKARWKNQSRGGRVSARGDQHVDDLPVLVDGPVNVTPDTVDLHVGFINKPTLARRATAKRAASANSA